MARKPPLIIYHKGCRDGFAAAWVCRKRWPGADFHAADYGSDWPATKGRDVVIVDFTYPAGGLLDIFSMADSLVVIDHHKPSGLPRMLEVIDAISGPDDAVEANVAPLPLPEAWPLPSLNPWLCFDNERSGAGLAWDVLFPGEPRPWLVNYVEDRDIWRWALPDSQAINAWIGLLPFDFDAWDRADGDMCAEDAANIGNVLLTQRQRYIERVCSRHRRQPFAGHDDIPVVNSSLLQSEIGNELAHDAPFAVVWYLDEASQTRRYSLRSVEGGANVAEIAKGFGGGGHFHAAGFEWPHLRHPDSAGARKEAA